MRGRQDWVVSTESGASMLPSERYKGLFRTGPQLSPGAGMGAGFVQVTAAVGGGHGPAFPFGDGAAHLEDQPCAAGNGHQHRVPMGHFRHLGQLHGVQPDAFHPAGKINRHVVRAFVGAGEVGRQHQTVLHGQNRGSMAGGEERIFCKQHFPGNLHENALLSEFFYSRMSSSSFTAQQYSSNARRKLGICMNSSGP